MNSTPAASKAERSAAMVDDFESDPVSILEMVFAATLAFSARSRTLHPNAARAILICSGLIGYLSQRELTAAQ